MYNWGQMYGGGQPGFGWPAGGYFGGPPGFGPYGQPWLGPMPMGYPMFGGYGPGNWGYPGNQLPMAPPAPGWGGPGASGWGGPGATGWGYPAPWWGDNYPSRFAPNGLPCDDDIVQMTYDSILADPLIPANVEINVDSDAGVVTLTGTVPTKQVKHAAGDDAWWIPGVDDVHNDIQVQVRRPREEQEGREGGEQRPARRAIAAGQGQTQNQTQTRGRRG